MAVLANGYNVQLNQVTSNGTPKHMYPITRAKDVILADGTDVESEVDTLEDAIAGIETNFVEKAQLGVASNETVTGVATLDTNGKLVDAQLAAATASVKGGVKIADAVTSNASDTATSTKWGTGIETDIDNLEANISDIKANYVEKAQLGVATTASATGVATLDANGVLVDAQLAAASGTVKGGVKITDTFKANAQDDASDVAASEKLVRTVSNVANAATPKTWLGVASNTDTGVTGVATLDDGGKVPSSQLPSYVDDVIDVVAEDKNSSGVVTALYFDTEKTQAVTPETGKIYINTTNNMTYRWSGTVYAVVASDLALGETSSTAYRGDYGKIAYDHAMNLLPNGDAQTNTNPHGTTKADVGLGSVDNMSYTDIESNVETNIMTNAKIEAALGYVPVPNDQMVSTTQDGLFSSTDYASFQNMKEVIVSTTSAGATFASGNGIWVEIVSDDDNP